MGMLWPVTKAHQATRALCFRVTDNLSSFLSVLWTDWVLVAGSLGVPLVAAVWGPELQLLEVYQGWKFNLMYPHGWWLVLEAGS